MPRCWNNSRLIGVSPLVCNKRQKLAWEEVPPRLAVTGARKWHGSMSCWFQLGRYVNTRNQSQLNVWRPFTLVYCLCGVILQTPPSRFSNYCSLSVSHKKANVTSPSSCNPHTDTHFNSKILAHLVVFPQCYIAFTSSHSLEILQGPFSKRSPFYEKILNFATSGWILAVRQKNMLRLLPPSNAPLLNRACIPSQTATFKNSNTEHSK